MVKIGIGLLITLSLLLIGCAQPAPAQEISETVDPADYEATHQNNNWVGPVEINISNLHLNAVAEPPQLPPIRVHYGEYKLMVKQWNVSTEENDTTMSVPLPLPPDKDISSILVESDLGKDQPVVESYDSVSNMLVITGLAEKQERLISVSYLPMAPYVVSVVKAENCHEGYVSLPDKYFSWIKIEKEKFLLHRGETTEVPFSITVANAVPSGQRYEVWLNVASASPGSGITIRTETNVRVTMDFK